MLVQMREAHATGSRLQRKVCVPPLAPCQMVNDEHMLVRRVQEFTFMFTAGHLQRRQLRGLPGRIRWSAAHNINISVKMGGKRLLEKGKNTM